MEPPFEENTEVFLVKENNAQSEQTFSLHIQIINSVPPNSGFSLATHNQDYAGMPSSTIILFPPNFQRYPISFDLLPDNIPESTEAFQLSSESDRAPLFESPKNFFQQTFIVIEDNDGPGLLSVNLLIIKLLINVMLVFTMSCIHLLLILVVVRIGFVPIQTVN